MKLNDTGVEVLTMFGQLIAYLRGLARRHKISAELEDEMRFHVERQIEANVRRGMSPAEARRMARLEFGGIARSGWIHSGKISNWLFVCSRSSRRSR